MTSVERVLEYSKLEPEASLNSEPKYKPPPSWPEKGVISTNKANFSYTKDGQRVLKDLTFRIRGREKVSPVIIYILLQ